MVNQTQTTIKIDCGHVFSPLGKDDPILQELWEVKRQINRDAQYSVQERSRQLQSVTIESARRFASLNTVG